MSRRFYTEVKKFKIYMIFHPLTKEFFVHFTNGKTLERAFSTHWGLQNQYTRDLFLKYRGTIYPPEIYLLEEIQTTLSRANTRKILWIKYFREQQFTCLNDVFDIEATDDLYKDNKEAYATIASIPVNDILCEKNRQCINYDIRRTKEAVNDNGSQRRQAKFFCDAQEYLQIEELAAHYKKTKSAYLREVALQGFVLQIDYDSIKEHTKQLSLIRNEINALIKLFVDTNEVYQGDIETIIDLLEQIRDSENELLERFRKEQTSRTRMIKKMITKVLNKAEK